nr:unnamed protein product [Callosobruchus chinensis]
MTIRRYALPPLLLLCLAVVTRVVCSPDGAPTRACATMTPFHGGGIPLSRARTPSGEVLGSFEAVDPEHSHTINCVQRADTVTHNSPEEKDHIDVDWIPPRDMKAHATIAQAYDTFWVAQSSPVLQYTSTGQDDLLPDRPSDLLPSKPPLIRPSSIAASRGQLLRSSTPSTPAAPPPNYALGFRKAALHPRGDRYDYELKVDRNDALVAVGLSEDAKMGDDSVMSCVKTNREWTLIWNGRILAIRSKGSEIVVNGAIYCRIRRNAVTVVNGKTFDQLRDTYHLLVAAGTDLKRKSNSKSLWH